MGFGEQGNMPIYFQGQGNIGKYFKEQGNETNFGEHGTWKFLKSLLRNKAYFLSAYSFPSEAFPWGLGNKGNMSIYFQGQGNIGKYFKGTRERN